MAFAASNIPSGKDLLIEHNQDQLRQLKLAPEKETVSHVYSPSWIPYKIARSTPDEYRKRKQVFDSFSIDLIYKNKEFDAFVWHTTADKIKEAVRYGIVTTYSVTGKVISALGQYRVIELERLQQGTISNRYHLKNALLDSFQDRFTFLEPLELLVNSHASLEQIEGVLQVYLSQLRDHLKNPNETLDADSKERLTASIQLDILQAEKCIQQLNQEKAIQATGVDSLLTFVKTQMIRNLRELQNINQNITYRTDIYFAATRGDLNSCIEDAEKVIEDYDAPPRDVLLPSHHGDYGDDNTQIAYDSTQHAASSDKARRALLAISFIEAADKLDLSQPDRPSVNGKPIKTVAATKWGTSGNPQTLLKKSLAWMANVGIKLVFATPDLFTLGMIPILRKLATYELKVQNPDSPVLVADRLQEMIVLENNSLGSRVRYFLRNAIKNSVEDIFYGINDIYKSITVNLFNDIYDDYASGGKQKPLAIALQEVAKEIESIAVLKDKEKKEILLAINRKRKVEEIQYKAPLLGEKFAAPEYIPSAGEWNDLFNSIAYGGEQFVGLFIHNIHAKHPFTGMLFNLSYLIGGLAVLSPKYVAFLGARYIQFAQGLGYSMATDPVTAALSSGVTQAELISAGFEGLIHGTHSWMATSVNQFEHDPAIALVYTGTAVGLGYLIAYGLQIPWLSEYLREDLGTFPPSALGFAGAKLGLLVVELLAEHDYDAVLVCGHVDKVKAFLVAEFKKDQPHVSDEQAMHVINQTLGILFSEANIAELKRASGELQFDGERSLLFSRHEIERAQIGYFLMKHHQHLQHLSVKSKFALVSQFGDYFTPAEARSLKKYVYPESATSILRTTLAIIFGYVVYPARMMIAAGSAIRQGNRQPIVNAGGDFALKVETDITRVLRGTSKIIKTTANFIRRQLKTTADVIVNSALGRSEALIAHAHPIANAGYTASAALDVAYEKSRQFFSRPVDAAVKAVTFAHPESEKVALSSYIKILRTTGYQRSQSVSASLSDHAEDVLSRPMTSAADDVALEEALSDSQNERAPLIRL